MRHVLCIIVVKFDQIVFWIIYPSLTLRMVNLYVLSKYYAVWATYYIFLNLKGSIAPIATSKYYPMTWAWCICLEGVTRKYWAQIMNQERDKATRFCKNLINELARSLTNAKHKSSAKKKKTQTALLFFTFFF